MNRLLLITLIFVAPLTANAKDCLFGDRFERADVEKAIASEHSYNQVKIVSSRMTILSPTQEAVEIMTLGYNSAKDIYRNMDIDVVQNEKTLHLRG